MKETSLHTYMLIQKMANASFDLTLLLAKSIQVSPSDVRKIEKLVFEHRDFVMEKYNEFHRR